MKAVRYARGSVEAGRRSRLTPPSRPGRATRAVNNAVRCDARARPARERRHNAQNKSINNPIFGGRRSRRLHGTSWRLCRPIAPVRRPRGAGIAPKKPAATGGGIHERQPRRNTKYRLQSTFADNFAERYKMLLSSGKRADAIASRFRARGRLIFARVTLYGRGLSPVSARAIASRPGCRRAPTTRRDYAVGSLPVLR